MARDMSTRTGKQAAGTARGQARSARQRAAAPRPGSDAAGGGKAPGQGAGKGKGQLKRAATEAALIEAFGRVVRRKGLRNVGVNEVVKEAGVGKALIYRYFGGLPGLVEAWGRAGRIWPEAADLVPISDTAGAQALKAIVVRNAQVHRDDPVRVEMLADELMTPTAISAPLGEIRQRVGQEHAAAFARNDDFRRHRLFMVVMMAAASYLAMRAVKAPRYMGEDLADEATWARLMAEIEAIIEKVAG